MPNLKLADLLNTGSTADAKALIEKTKNPQINLAPDITNLTPQDVFPELFSNDAGVPPLPETQIPDIVSSLPEPPINDLTATQPQEESGFMKFLKGAGKYLGNEMARSELGPSIGNLVGMATGGNVDLMPKRTAEDVFSQPFNNLTNPEKDFVIKNYDSYLSKLASQKALGSGNLDLKSEQGKQLTNWMASSKDIDDMDSKIDFAIKQKDPTVMAMIANRLAGISSVAIQQGVVSDEEARRILGGVMSNFKTVEAGGFKADDVQRMLSSDTWKSAKNMASSVNDGLKARMKTYRDIYNVPSAFFSKAGVQLDTPKMTESGLSEENVITQKDIDKATFKANMISKLVQGANTIQGWKELASGLAGAVGVDIPLNRSMSIEELNSALDKIYEQTEKRKSEKPAGAKSGEKKPAKASKPKRKKL